MALSPWVFELKLQFRQAHILKLVVMATLVAPPNPPQR
jgi:hypothetical protein